MRANDANAMGDIAVDLPFIRQYKNGHIERLWRSSSVPASEDSRGVATRDVVIDRGTGVSARLFLPSSAAGRRRLLPVGVPVVVYVHGGSFCTGSAFGRVYHRYAASLAASTGALIVSVEYRLAPEHPVPAAYDDAWAALRWVATLSDPWLAEHADGRRMFLAGDSAGGNIAYNMALRASNMDQIHIEGLIMVHPFFWAAPAQRLPSEERGGVGMYSTEILDRIWPFVTKGQASNTDPRIDPLEEEMALLKCRRVLVAVANKDLLRHRALQLAAHLHDNERQQVTLVEADCEDHGFQLYSPLRDTSKKLMQSIVQFVNHSATSWPPEPHATEVEVKTARSYCALSLPTRPFKALLMTSCNSTTHVGTISNFTSLAIGRGKASSKTRYTSVSALLPTRTFIKGSYATNNFY